MNNKNSLIHIYLLKLWNEYHILSWYKNKQNIVIHIQLYLIKCSNNDNYYMYYVYLWPPTNKKTYYWRLVLFANIITDVQKSGLRFHDDVIKRKHFPRYCPFVRAIHQSPVNSPHTCQWRGVLMFSLICAWINGWINNRETGDLRRNHAHYDVTVINIKMTLSIVSVYHIIFESDTSKVPVKSFQ